MRTWIPSTEQRGWAGKSISREQQLVEGSEEGGGCLLEVGYRGSGLAPAICLYFPLSTHKSQAERWEAAAVATLRSLFRSVVFPVKMVSL